MGDCISVLLCFAKQPGTHGRGSQLPDREMRSKGPEPVTANRKAEMGMYPVLRDRVEMKSFGDLLENIFLKPSSQNTHTRPNELVQTHPVQLLVLSQSKANLLNYFLLKVKIKSTLRECNKIFLNREIRESNKILLRENNKIFLNREK